MMWIAILLAAMPAAQEPPPLVVPTDWSVVPPLPWRNPPSITPDLATFVEGEVSAGRCTAVRAIIDVEAAVYVRGDGQIRAVVPRAIGCPTVEQFAAGLISSFARNNLRQPAAGWYRTAITFDWSR